MRIEVNAKIILTAQGLEGAPLELEPEDIVLAAEQKLNNLPLCAIPDGVVMPPAKAQYGIRVHMNKITQITE